MTKPVKFAKGSAQQSIYQALCDRDLHVKKTLERLLNSVPMPLDGPCLGFVCTAAMNALEAAFALIPDLNTKGQSLLNDLKSLDTACKQVYAERGVVDAFETMTGRKTLFTGWKTLAFFSSNDLPISSARMATAGMEFALKMISNDRKLVAAVHMQQLGTGHLDYDLTSEELAKGFFFETMGLSEVLPWFTRAKKNFFRMLDAFSTNPPPLPPPPTVHERAIAQWKAHAAYPNYKQRAGVFDKTTASELHYKFNDMTVSGQAADGAAHKGLGVGQARLHPFKRTLLWVAHGFELLHHRVAGCSRAREAHHVMFTVHHQVGHLGHCREALDDGFFAATAFEIIDFDLHVYVHVDVL